MKVITLSVLILVVLSVMPVVAEEGYSCNAWVINVEEKPVGIETGHIEVQVTVIVNVPR